MFFWGGTKGFNQIISHYGIRPGPNTRCFTLNTHGAIEKAEILESARLRKAEAREMRGLENWR